MKPILALFLASWVFFAFAVLLSSTNAYEPSALYGLELFYLASLALFSLLLVTWRGRLFPLSLISSLFMAFVAGLPYLKYPLLYGTDEDNMFHYALAQSILNTGHVPAGNAYYGFTTFHSFAAIISLASGLPLITIVKLEIVLLPAMMSLAGFWIAGDVLRKRTTTKLAILGAFISFTPNYISAPQNMAAFLVILSLGLLLQFAKQGTAPPKQGFMLSLLLLILAVVITHHQTAFFTIFAFVGIGLLVPIFRGFLRTSAVVIQRIELIGLLALGFAYIWWTYYAGFTDLIRNVFSIIEGEPLQFQTTVGRGFSYYGPLAWTFRTLVNYSQRGQLLVWTGLGVLVSGVTLGLRRRSERIDSETHAIIFSLILLFLGVYAVFLFVPFFVIGADRFFRFISFVSPPFIAIGIETVYLIVKRVGTRLNFRIRILVQLPLLRAAVVFILLGLIFVELTGPLLLGGFYHSSSQYQADQIIFLNNHVPSGVNIISHLVISNQLQVYAPNFPVRDLEKPHSVSILYALYSTNQLPPDSYNALILLQRIGPAGTYFEAVNDYSNTTWVSPTLHEFLNLGATSVMYNSGEAFVAFEA